jgi:Tfp pilus assembly protein PilP
MPQKVIAKQMSLESASDPIAVRATVETVPAEAVAVESYADQLMDELFEGVDRAFESSGGQPAEPMAPEFVALKSISVPKIVLSPLAPEPQRGEKDVEAIARQVALETTKKQQSKQSFDRILLGAACGSLLLVMGLWLASRSGLLRLPAAPAPETPAASAPTAPDTQFVEYVQRSLEAIEQKKPPQPNPQLAGVPGVAPPGTLPSISISGAPPATAGLSTAVNRIADALEQAGAQPGAPAPQVVILPPPAQGTVDPTAPVAGSPAAPAAPQTAAVSPSPTARASGRAIAAAGTRTPLAASPSSSESPQPKILARETESAPAPSAQQSAPAPEQSAPAVSSAPTSAHTLVGILELGDRSAALFEVDGVARRIYVGESIGASGWTLAEIKNQEAVIRKGGDVRSVFVGQKF